MTIKYWPRSERPRERLLDKGASHLSDAELIAIFLRSGTHGKSAVELSRELLMHFGSLQKLLHASCHDFCQWPGLGLVKYAEIQAVLELSKRYWFESSHQNSFLKSPSHTKQFLLAKMRNDEQEIFGCIFLNNRNQVLAFKELFYGSIGKMEIYPREVIRHVMVHHASAIICAHNHPSGDPSPSEADITTTQHLRSVLALIDVKLLDHVIVGRNQAVSLAEEGFL